MPAKITTGTSVSLLLVGVLLDLPTHTGPAGRGKWRPDVGLEVRTSARRTNIERRFVATPSFSSLMKSPCVLEMTILAFLLLLHGSHGGFQSPDPEALSRTLFGSPCDCGGGTVTVRPNTYTRMIDCTDRTAYLAYRHTAIGISKQTWKCVRKPRVIPPNGDQPGPCPTDCKYLEALHSTCYSSTQQCSSASGTVYLTALQEREYAGTFGDELGMSPSSRGTTNKHAQASCGKENIGKNVCWPPRAPTHISDGGGPTDQIREFEIEASLKSPINIHYHRLASLEDPADNEEDGLQFSKLVQSESRCMRWWKAFREKCREAAVRKPMTGILRPHASGR
ncbi:uncharacterized protein [Notamacropus eugenii]|uniref:uncharacterized protein n=1 Tax=Notamacropus eugenii TaxID=9315 RepID=UPI003B66ED29